MSANVKRLRKERSRKPAQMILPADLYDYLIERPSHRRETRHAGESIDGIDHVTVVDDWPDSIPVTEAEVDIFERYFSDVLDRLFSSSAADHPNPALSLLTSDVNNKP
ncbi:hypothetical protein MUU53_08405 [Rhizobium lemnae]|uniref:Uncharacterized protein n=1 Tax=Rhizobium lemnae TaxID=1214924 RepID=A0ABV8E5L5_9HYPH|nr:hypothetical protein [Rhizobium lemnae]MCJ8507936.1 hypothetical protein [Rhizobium lemnae]